MGGQASSVQLELKLPNGTELGNYILIRSNDCPLSCNPATWRFRYDQMAAWKVSQASGSQVWQDLIVVLKAGYHLLKWHTLEG